MASLGRRLIAASACVYVLYSCGGRQKDIEEHGAGREGEECYPNGTCDAGLVCYKNRCVAPDDAGAAGEASGGGGSGGQGGTSRGGASGSMTDGGEDTGGSPTGGASMAGAMNAGSSGASGDGGVGGMGGNPNGGLAGASGTSGAGNAGGASGRANGGMGGAGAGGTAGRGMGGRGGFGNFGGGPAGGGGKGGTTGGAGSGTGGTLGGAGSGGVCPVVSQLFPASVPTGQASGLTGNVNPPGAPPRSFDGYLLQTPCSPTNCDDCSTGGWFYEGIGTGCGNPGMNAVQNFLVGGTPGERYRVTLHFYGIVEPKNYGNSVTRASGTMRPTNAETGANPPPWAYATGNPNYTMSDYNTYEIHVVDNNGMELCSYFLNSDTQEGHWTYVLDYEKTIDVVGGGRIRVRHYDRNCRMIKNCQAGGTQGLCSATGCVGKARLLDVSSAVPQPSGLVQPGLGQADGQAGQWLFIDVTNVTCGQPALACNGM